MLKKIKKITGIASIVVLSFLLGPALAQESVEHDELLKVSSYKISSLKLVKLNRRFGLEIGFAPVFQNNSNETILDFKADFSIQNSKRLELTDNEVVLNILPPGEVISTGDTISILIKRWPRFRRVRLEPTFDTLGVMGLDLDKDGIRDDLEAFVSTAFNGTATAQVSELVKVTNGVLSLDPTAPGAAQSALELTKSGAASLACLGETVGELEAQVFYRTLLVEAYDTSIRIDRYLAYIGAMGGTSIRIEPAAADACPT